MSDPLFTFESATALLPRVRQELELMRESLAYLRRLSVTLSPASDTADGDLSPMQQQAFRQLAQAGRRLTDLGIQVKDVDSGLVDFPALRRGETVLLCWREPETAVEWFHDLESGFGGRRPAIEWEPH